MRTRTEITQINTTAGPRYLACLVNGSGFDQVFIASKTFKTLKGAQRWAERKRAGRNDLMWIKSVLSNDEVSSDEELVALFTENGLTEAEAKQWVAKRSYYLNNIVLLDDAGTDIGIYKPGRN